MNQPELVPFDAIDDAGHPIEVRTDEGWLLLYWYPRADTPGCVAQAESIRDNWEAFTSLGCRVLGASFDPPERNAAFRAKYRLPFRLLSDQAAVVARQHGTADEDRGVARRVAFLVGPDGRIRRRYDVTDPSMFADAVLDDLEAEGAGSTDGPP